MTPETHEWNDGAGVSITHGSMCYHYRLNDGHPSLETVDVLDEDVSLPGSVVCVPDAVRDAVNGVVKA